jgi:hypothetical protein
MSHMITRVRNVALALALALTLPAAASAQAAAPASALDTSQATAFLGAWTVSMDAQGQVFEMDLTIADTAGKVSASMGAPQMGGMQNITNVARSGENLVLRYQIDAQGQMAPVAVTLRPNGQQLAATMDFADGMFVMTGTATKKPM